MAKETCVICAWRATCNKKFSLSGREMRCSDFTLDVLAQQDEENGEDKA